MPNQVKQLLKDLETQIEQSRIDSQEKRLSMYLDDYESVVLDKLRTQFHKDNYDRLFPMIATYYNLLKKVVNLKAVLYKREAKRIWSNRDNKPDEKYNEMIAATNINNTMSTINKLTEVNNTSFLRIMPDEEKKIIQYEAVPSENISVIQNPENPTEIVALLHRVVIKDSTQSITNALGNNIARLRFNTSKYTAKYFYWDKESFITLDTDQKIILDEENPYKDDITGQGIIPYVLFTNMESIAGSIWNETVDADLYNGTIQVNVFQTYFNNLLKTAGYRTPYITGLSEQEVLKLNNKVNDPLQPLGLEDPDAKVGTFELSTKIGEFQSAIHDVISEIADNHGVEFSSRTSSAQKMSGLALSISQGAINDLREEQQPKYRNSESEVAKKTVVIVKKKFNTIIDVEGKFSINFAEDKEQTTVDEKIKQDEFYIKNNLKSITDIYREIDPDADSNEEAMKRIMENKKINDELTDIFPFEPAEDDNVQAD